MHRASQPQQASSRVERLIWASFFAAHAYWFFAGLLRGTLGFESAVTITLSNVFFALKIADVAWLRVNWTARSLLAATLVVLLLHVGVVERAGGAATDWLPTSLTLMSALAWMEWPRLAGHWQRITQALTALCSQSQRNIYRTAVCVTSDVRGRYHRTYRASVFGWRAPTL